MPIVVQPKDLQESNDEIEKIKYGKLAFPHTPMLMPITPSKDQRSSSKHPNTLLQYSKVE